MEWLGVFGGGAILFFIGALVAALVWFIARSRQAVLAAQLTNRSEQLLRLETELKEEHATILKLHAENGELRALLETEKARTKANLVLLEDAQQTLANQFRALSVEALERSNASFLQLASENLGKWHQAAKSDLDQRSQAMAALLQPVNEHLTKLDQNLREIEKTREGAYHGLYEQAAMMRQLYQELKAETGNLTRALRAPTVRGRWGEIQLRRVVELAGMLNHCDFYEQVQTPGDKRLRPDLVVRLPGGKSVIVDAKAPLEAYLAAVEADDEDSRRSYLRQHARQIRNHIKALSEKTYWENFEGDSPEFTILFLPGEHFFAAALEHDPILIEVGVEQSVLLATPTSLISLLRAVAYGWRQERLAQNAREIASLGREMYKRLMVFSGHLAKMGKGLETAASAYNSAVGAFDSRVLVQARKLAELDSEGLGETLEPPSPVEVALRRSASLPLALESEGGDMDETALASFFAQQRFAQVETYLKTGRRFNELSSEELQNQWRLCFTALADDPSHNLRLERIIQLEAEFALRGDSPNFSGMENTVQKLNSSLRDYYRYEATADPGMFARFTADLETEIAAAAIPIDKGRQN